MKVNKSKEHATVSIRNLFVGQTFTAPRKGYGYLKTGGEIGYYMKVDQSSGLTNSLKQSEDLAVNLETGQLASLIRIIELQKYQQSAML